MNRDDLEKRLREKGIPQDAYVLSECFLNEVFCLSNKGDDWEVYYSERGIKTQLKKFDTESAACEYFYNQLLKIFEKN
jgi:hypothetical protein